jgi:hypothetical protein
MRATPMALAATCIETPLTIASAVSLQSCIFLYLQLHVPNYSRLSYDWLAYFHCDTTSFAQHCLYQRL